jgi:hypothetical protein
MSPCRFNGDVVLWISIAIPKTRTFPSGMNDIFFSGNPRGSTHHTWALMINSHQLSHQTFNAGLGLSRYFDIGISIPMAAKFNDIQGQNLLITTGWI